MLICIQVFTFTTSRTPAALVFENCGNILNGSPDNRHFPSEEESGTVTSNASCVMVSGCGKAEKFQYLFSSTEAILKALKISFIYLCEKWT